MKSKLKIRVNACETLCKHKELELNTRYVYINSKIKFFGDLREMVIISTVGRFKTILQCLGKLSNTSEYSIPQQLQRKKIELPELDLPELSAMDKFTQLAPVLNSGIKCAGQALNFYAANLGRPVATPKKVESGLLLLDLAGSIFNYLAAREAQAEAEETAVRDFEKQTREHIEKIDSMITFLRDGVLTRINELETVSYQLLAKSDMFLTELEVIKDQFNMDDEEHIRIFNQAFELVKTVSNLSKVQILDNNNQLSDADEKFIIECKNIIS